MQPFDLDNLVGDVYYEIFRHVGAYTLNNVSLTSKHIRLNALTERLWKTHREREFPHSLEKGSPFEQYSKCKRKSLREIDDPITRKWALLIEAGHLNEIKENWPKDQPRWLVENFLRSDTLNNKPIPLLINEQEDQEMKDFFYEKVKKIKSMPPDYHWEIAFGKVELLKGDIPHYYLFKTALSCGSIDSLDYLVQQIPDLPMSEGFHAIDIPKVGLRSVKWLSDHNVKFYRRHLNFSLKYYKKELVRFFLEKMSPSFFYIKIAAEKAVEEGQPDLLEVLLPRLSQDKSLLNDLLGCLNFEEHPEGTAACLKILLDNGADADHPMGPDKNLTLLSHVHNHPNNELSIEVLEARLLQKRSTHATL